MPILIVEWFEGRSVETKAKLAKAITEQVVKILDVPPDSVRIIYHDIPKHNVAKAGTLASEKWP